MVAPDWKADGKQEAVDWFIHRLDFPIRRWDYSFTERRSAFVLGHPATRERDVQPLRAGQAVQFYGAMGAARIGEVGEGIIWIEDSDFLNVRPYGVPALFRPKRLTRLCHLQLGDVLIPLLEAQIPDFWE